MSTTGLAPDLSAYFAQLEAHLPDFSLEDQRTALAIYRELAKGEPVDDAQLAAAMRVSLEEARARRASPPIATFTYPDTEGRVIGFGGLAAAPMHHEFTVNGRKLWTWCAWDSLFIPQLLGAEARVVSPDPHTKNPVRLLVTPDGVAQVEPPGAVVSFVRPDAESFTNSAKSVMARFCHYVFFFEARESGEAWTADHPDAVLHTVDEAMELARALNRRNFGAALRSAAGGASHDTLGWAAQGLERDGSRANVGWGEVLAEVGLPPFLPPLSRRVSRCVGRPLEEGLARCDLNRSPAP